MATMDCANSFPLAANITLVFSNLSYDPWRFGKNHRHKPSNFDLASEFAFEE